MNATLVFDLDGTLVDAVPDFASALNRTLAKAGLGNVSHEEVAGMLGDGPRALLQRAFAARGGELDEASYEDFLADYTANAAIDSRAYPQVAQTLDALRGRGWRFAVCTNKPEAATRHLLGALGLLPYFDAIGAGDSFAFRKPDPRHLAATLERAGAEVARAVMVGDHANDVAAAKGVGMPCIFAGWGYGRPEMAQGAARVAARFADLAELAPQLLARA
jgi:phosphoglycolate phosphatase